MPASKHGRLARLLLAAVLVLVTTEVTLRVAPRGRSSLANAVYGVYGAFPGGIYFQDATTGVDFLRASFATEAFWNGYRWRHRTDELGFRNPPGLEDRSLWLLGDSFVYGHGVEEEQTVAHVLRTRYHRPAYNMARQGDCLYQSYVLTRLWADRLEPRQVVLFLFANDIADLFAYRTPVGLASPPELERYDYGALRARVEAQAVDPRYPLRRQLYRSKALRLLRALGAELRGPWTAVAWATPGADDPYAAALDPPTFEAAAAYYRLVLADMVPRLRRRGTWVGLVVLDVGSGAGPRAVAAGDRILGLAGELGRRHEVPVASTRAALESCPACVLPGDGHLSAAGHLRLAAFLDAEVLPSPCPKGPIC